jgi:rubrerythrin
MDSDIEIIRAAIETEIDGYRFFLDSAEKTAASNVRQIWLDLCRDEIEHMRLLQMQMSSLSHSGKWANIKVTVDEHLVKAPISAGTPVAKPAQSDLDALKEGLKVEENTFRFYEDAAKKMSGGAGKATYEQLAKMEWGHYKLLEETITLFNNPSEWEYLQSPPMLEG